jgi:Domain of unknown function (DUF4350)
MPLGLEASDRKLLLICGTVLLLLIVATVVLTPPDEDSESHVPTTYSSKSSGAEAAYLLLTRLHYPVRRWEDEPGELPTEPGNTLLILANPTDTPSKKERVALENFVKSGGRVLFTGPSLEWFFPDADISSLTPDPKWTTYAPYIPSEISRGAEKVTMQPDAVWGRLNENELALYGDPDAAVVVAWHYGAGEIFWWAGPTPLTNAGITQDDNLNFFLNSVANWKRGEDYKIYWDEYFHGERSSLWSYASHTSITWGLMQIGLIAAAVVFTFSRRSGPIYKPAGVSRLSPLEYVDTLGGLYQRAKAGSAAVSVSLQRLRYLLTRQLGMPSDVPDAELAHAAEERLAWKGFESEKLLPRAAAAVRSDSVTSREALDLVQHLEACSAKLEIRSTTAKEKP